MKNILSILFCIISFCVWGQYPVKEQKADIRVTGNNNVIRVIQGNTIKDYDLDKDGDYQKFISYLLGIPQMAKDLKSIERLVKNTNLALNKIDQTSHETNQLVKGLVDKSKESGVFDPAKFLEEFGKITVENSKLKEEVETLRQQTKDTELSEVLAEANKALDRFDNEAYQHILELYKSKRKAKLAEEKKEIARLSYLQAQNSRITYAFNKALIQIDEALTYEPDNAYYLSEKGLIYYNKGEYDEALECYQKALVLKEKLFGEKLLETAITYNMIGVLYRENGEFTTALEYFQKSLLIHEKISGMEDANIGVYYNNIGTIYEEKGEYTKALEYYQKSLVILTNTLGKEDHTLAKPYSGIGSVYSSKGEYNKALEYFQKALEICENFYGKEHPTVATIYFNIGITYTDKGNDAKALEYCQKALLIREKVLGKEHPSLADSYNSIGNIYNSNWESDKALELYLKALGIQEKFFTTFHPSVATSYNNIGFIYNHQGLYDKALEYHQKALLIFENLFGSQHPSVAHSYVGIGEAFSYKEEYDRALENFQKALSIREKVLGKEHPYVVGSYQEIGFAYIAKGDKERGKQLLNQFSFAEKTDYEKAETLCISGVEASLRGRYFATVRYYELAIELLEDSKTPQSDALWTVIYQNFARIQCNCGFKDKSLPLFEKAIEFGKKAKMDMRDTISNYEECKKKAK